MTVDNKISFIGINALLQHAQVPEYVLITTIAHELTHYAHGFGSPLPRCYEHPHANNVVERELERREHLYRDGRPAPNVQGRTVILVDDGLATGATMRAAIAALQQQQPAHIVVAVPVAAPSVCEELGMQVDEIVCARTPEPFYGVGFWYDDFSQTTDEEVHDLLARSMHEQAVPSHEQQTEHQGK